MKYTNIYIYINLYTWNPNGAPCFDWNFGLLLEGSTPKTKDKQVPGTYIYIYNYIYIKQPSDANIQLASNINWPSNRMCVAMPKSANFSVAEVIESSRDVSTFQPGRNARLVQKKTVRCFTDVGK